MSARPGGSPSKFARPLSGSSRRDAAKALCAATAAAKTVVRQPSGRKGRSEPGSEQAVGRNQKLARSSGHQLHALALPSGIAWTRAGHGTCVPSRGEPLSARPRRDDQRLFRGKPSRQTGHTSVASTASWARSRARRQASILSSSQFRREPQRSASSEARSHGQTIAR
jgi:hypothetical protein